MTEEEAVGKIHSYRWERWLERPFRAFVQSFFEDSTRPESFEKLGFTGVTLRGTLFQNGFWYTCDELFHEMDAQLETWLGTHTIFDVTTALERFQHESLARIEELVASSAPVEVRFAEIYGMLSSCCSFIWMAHGLESYYQRRLKEEVHGHVPGDADKFIGDASFPSKKNQHALLEEKMRTEASNEDIAAEFAWLKCRDGFAAGFTAEDIGHMRSDLAPHEAHVRIEIPAPLEPLFKEIRELVYYRTARTDVFYQLMYAARPLFIELGQSIGVSLEELKFFRSKSLIEGRRERFTERFTYAYIDGCVIFRETPILEEVAAEMVREFKGSIAYKGVVRGTVRIVKDASQIGKVNQGEILVTQMTFPSFLPAMIRASAFVTDEGGITCHAAIVAREMRKPCIIGTKVATSVLNDGDLIEVDADKGVVRKLV